MKETHTDPETGWQVTIETGQTTINGQPIITETITNPETGETACRTHMAGTPNRNISKWIEEIAKEREEEERWEIEQMKKVHKIYPELAQGAGLPNGPLPNIKLHFAQTFARWEIYLPEDAVTNRQRGKINQAGWAIWYLFGSDEKGEYLDYYSAHRMTEDDHVRVYETGESETLDSIVGMRRASLDPEEDARLEQEHLDENRRIAAMLEAKGFGITGEEPGGVQIQRFLRLEKPEK